MLNVNQTSRALSLMEQADRLVCMTHSNPDGDAVGALLGLAAILQRRFPEKVHLSLCKDSPPASFDYLAGVRGIRHRYEPQRGDLTFFLDTAEPRLTELHEDYPRLFVPDEAREDGISTVKIDHHPDGAPFTQLDFTDPSAASSCEIIVDLADALNFEIAPDTATCLLTGIYTDTGSMMHSNTGARVYSTCARLLRAGADHGAIVRNVFRTQKLSTLKLWGVVLEKISLTREGGAVSALTASDFRGAGAGFPELTGAIDYVNSIPGMRFSLILSERNGKVKGSLRTLREDVDVSAMARKFTGGGHRKAAGFSVPGKLEEETRWKVVPDGDGLP